MTEGIATVDLSSISDEDLIAEIEERRYESDAISEYLDEVGEEAVAEHIDGMAVVEIAKLEELNDHYWTHPEKAPAVFRSWLQRITGRV